MITETQSQTLAPGFYLFPRLKPPNKTINFHRLLLLIITFLAYASFHASRKPPSIVKSVLAPTVPSNSSVSVSRDNADAGWAPFDGPGGTQRLGELDLVFLLSYSVGMYFAGHTADRIDLRLFLSFGMLGSGLFTIAFGFGYWWNVHRLLYFLVIQVFCGLFQSIGWPCVVAVVGNWFGRENRGLIMGLWASHTSVGNIVGSVVASAVLEYGWGWSFVVPGVLVILVGVLVFLFLVVRPEDIDFERHRELEMDDEVSGMGGSENMESDVGLEPSPEEVGIAGKVRSMGDSERAGLLGTDNLDQVAAIGFLEAWMLPGVRQYACCLFFSKLVAYTFLYWLPFYIRHTASAGIAAVAGMHLSHKTAGILSTIFDIGGVLGGILAGLMSDAIEARAVTSIIFLVLSVPTLGLYRIYGSVSMVVNILLMFFSGLLVNGPYALITTAVAADLGTQDLLNGNSRALATVTAIIDGTGSLGAALGPLLAGYVSTIGWNYVFAMLIGSIISAGMFLSGVARTEIRAKLDEGKWLSGR